MIRKILIADRGLGALRIVRACHRLGIKSVAVYFEAEKHRPHTRLADEAVLLGSAAGQLESQLLEAAKRTVADAIHPGCNTLAANADFADACETSGLTFIGPSPEQHRAASKAKEVAQKLGIPVSTNREGADSRLIEIPMLGDQHGKVVHLCNRETSICRHGRKLLSESPAPLLDSDLAARMAESAVRLARGIGCSNAVTFRFLLDPGGEFHYLENEPFLSDGHAITEAVTGLDLVQLQIEIAEGRGLPAEAPQISGHAIGASLYPDAPGALPVWQPPATSSDVRIDADIAEGMSVQPDSPLAELVAVDAARAGTIRKLTRSLETLWIGGVSANRELLLHILQSQEFQDGKVCLGFLDGYTLESPADETADFLLAVACVLYLEGSRHAQQSILPNVPPNYRNNPWRRPSMALRIGARNWTVYWRRVSQNRYHVRSEESELDAEVVSLQPQTMFLVLDGILREFRFREVAEVVYVYSALGSRVIHCLSRYQHPETRNVAQSQAALVK
jgi:acetyl/propionyl-CoA carboxylase alpha subunit